MVQPDLNLTESIKISQTWLPWVTVVTLSPANTQTWSNTLFLDSWHWQNHTPSCIRWESLTFWSTESITDALISTCPLLRSLLHRLLHPLTARLQTSGWTRRNVMKRIIKQPAGNETTSILESFVATKKPDLYLIKKNIKCSAPKMQCYLLMEAKDLLFKLQL